MAIFKTFWYFSRKLLPLSLCFVLPPLVLGAQEADPAPAAVPVPSAPLTVTATETGPEEPALNKDPALDMVAVEAAWAAGDFARVRQGLKQLASEGGGPLVQYRYGRVLLEGRGGPQDLAAAQDWLERAAAQNQLPAAVLLARLYLQPPPGFPAADPGRAAVLLRRAAVRGDPAAQYYLGLLYSTGQGVTADPIEAQTWMQVAAENGEAEAQFLLSQAYASGAGSSPEAGTSKAGTSESGALAPHKGLGLAKDPAAALRWLQAAARAGHGEAQYYLAYALDRGQGVARNPADALNWLRRAAEGGFLRAQVALGQKYLKGDGVTANPDEALRWLALGVGAGDLAATEALGLALLGGSGIARNPQQAWSLLSQAAAAGSPRASYALGQMLEQGLAEAAEQGTALDQAVQMYRQAVEQGSQEALLHLGTMTLSGQLDGSMAPHRMVPWVAALRNAAPQDSAAAADWLRGQAEAGLRPAQLAWGQWLLAEDPAAAAPWLLQAAQRGATQAQHQLGRLYIQGEGVSQDYVQAHKWLNIAAAGGSSAALEMRATVADLMTPEQVAEAQTQVRTFFAASQPERGTE
ncbi:SEL1-like repeat protein [Pseudophaeobacter flagellatus]|uniref:SEL1-like repeat protein n=1 Tax=Pseudophaeobacter flagellatus TaxID=2899119 RepID=UPI001E4B707D|nr:SEL1-like repeat protein [Pseudophaeobacter flagellatus]MCD9149784.1 SEL1-like repeat protein [Pseudophaeobacter flagellatus]